MSNVSFESYQSDVLDTAYYLDEPLENQQKIIYFGFNEEVNELLTERQHPEEYVNLLWGREVEPGIKQDMVDSKKSEVGDVLYYISAACSQRNIRLGLVATKSFELFIDDIKELESFEELDEALEDKIALEVPNSYSPDYSSMQMWNMPPWQDITSGILNEPDKLRPPLSLQADALYALERISRTFSEILSYPELYNDKRFIANAALVLGGLCVVSQARLETPLSQAAEANMTKRSRRIKSHTLEEGWDIDRSRASGEDRPNFESFDNTRANLLNQPIPN
jgi:NTP pyrophosphatase (non-canonical NTP hydrolase)